MGEGSPPKGRAGASAKLHRQIFDIVSTRIADGALSHGEILREARLASDFGISRAPVRQALGALLQAGLVSKDGPSGYRVVGSYRVGVQRSPSRSAMPPLHVAPSWEGIYQIAERAIAARMALGSWRLNESEMARFFGVSRTVVREVLARLQERGLVRKDRSSRWVAPGLTPDYVGELYEMRWVLEPVALRSASGRMPRREVGKARRNLLKAIDNASRLSGADLDELERELHVDLLSRCENVSLSAAIQLYQSLLVAHSFLYDRMPRLFPVEPFLNEHLDVVEKLWSGHEEEACVSLASHLRVSRDRAIERIERVSSMVVSEEHLDAAPYVQRTEDAIR